MRQIVLDTETTGIDPKNGHRIIEIGCVELVDRKLTGNHFHVYINPQREIEQEAIDVHGITNEFLSDKLKGKNITFYTKLADLPLPNEFPHKDKQQLVVFDDQVNEKNQDIIKELMIRGRKIGKGFI